MKTGFTKEDTPSSALDDGAFLAFDKYHMPIVYS